MIRVFVDGQEGTTGLEIYSRLEKRADVELLRIAPEKKKDPAEREKYLNGADVVFLCLPDEAAKESAERVKNPRTRVIDASTAHRVDEAWAYGLPELGPAYRERIAGSKRVSNPGCFATGFNILVAPLTQNNVLPADSFLTCHAVTGYSGGGRKLIAYAESEEGARQMASPCFYALGLSHKHLPEMQKHGGLASEPLFTPIVGNFYRGMTVAVPLSGSATGLGLGAAEILALYREFYRGQPFVKVQPFRAEQELPMGYLNAEGCNFTNNIEIFVFGDERRILLAARLDNLGKGASGAAVQNMNLLLGIDEKTGLET